ncbi:putative ribonuclease H-like domain-containing protein, partial [Tanacetum coccineum]
MRCDFLGVLHQLLQGIKLMVIQFKDSPDAGFKPSGEEEKIDFEHQENEDCEVPNTQEPRVNQEQDANVNSTNNINTVNPVVSVANIENNDVDENIVYGCDYPSWIEAMQDELLQFKLQKVWTLVDLPHGKRAIEKDLYGLHQAPRARYETLSTYLLENGFRRGTIDKTLFIKKDKGNILLVQVYVDDIIFGSIKKSLCVKFEQMMHKRFQISSMGELTFFLGLQAKARSIQVVSQHDGTFISQDKYVADILKKFDFATVKTASTPIETNNALLKDEEAKDVDVHLYRLMIGSLMILRYLKEVQPKLGLLVSRDSLFDLEAFFRLGIMLELGLLTRIYSNWRFVNFLQRGLFHGKSKKQLFLANSSTKAEYVAAANCCGQ